MKVVVRKDSASSAEAAALGIATCFRHESHGVLAVATGSSPQPLYEALATLVADGLDLGGITDFALDQYVGLHPSHPQSYRSIIDRDVTVPLRLDPSRVLVPEADAAVVSRAAAAYDSAIREAGGIRLQRIGDRHQRPHRLQRARLSSRLPHTGRAPGGVDPNGQQPTRHHPVGRAVGRRQPRHRHDL